MSAADTKNASAAATAAKPKAGGAAAGAGAGAMDAAAKAAKLAADNKKYASPLAPGELAHPPGAIGKFVNENISAATPARDKEPVVSLPKQLWAEDWIRAMEQDPDLVEVPNRPWANWKNRRLSGCLGNDFVHDKPTVLLRYFWNRKTRALTGACHFTIDAEGPPKGAHGASVAMVFDEILAYPVWASDMSAFTVNLNVNFVKMVPLLSTLKFDSRIVKQEGRKLYLEGDIKSADGKTVYSKASGLWLQAGHMVSTSIRSVL